MLADLSFGLNLSLKGKCYEIFDPWFFSLNCTPGYRDSWANFAEIFDYENRLRAMPHCAELIFFVS
jgi:hypothetical protein